MLEEKFDRFEGKLVRLRALRPEDAEHHLRWRNDPEVTHWATAGDPCFGPVTAEAVALGFDTMLRLNPRESAVFTVEDLAGGTVIGMADYRDLDPYAGVATLGVTIGEREFWGLGHGSDALRLLVDHLFGTYPLHRLELDTWSGNERAVRAFTRLGFREEGRRRSAVLLAGKRYDSVLFGMLREEWAKPTRDEVDGAA
ncbi:GNAT family N-acetyltransferase [Streptomyces sp. G3]|uniref:GNAT family N-acetyltransferase n=1 Tax=unclassified Streptomyces TaxID=2593676 RepID=UPI001F3DB44C|nr:MULTISPECIES: GNAT family protein [unclassified Streptomyces]MCM1936842.1 GNAT family N-acetyltransferase [Streptomyces sp. G3]WKX17905.1 GNAT family protein [Streptomyces sp. HUAS CX7]